MKKLIAVLLLASLSGSALAQTYKLTWTLTGFSSGGVNFPALELDVVSSGRYMSAHGAILTETRQLSPASGTCVQITGGFYCNLQIDRSSFFLAVDTKLNGKLTGRDAAGTVLPEATATLASTQ